MKLKQEEHYYMHIIVANKTSHLRWCLNFTNSELFMIKMICIAVEEFISNKLNTELAVDVLNSPGKGI